MTVARYCLGWSGCPADLPQARGSASGHARPAASRLSAASMIRSLIGASRYVAAPVVGGRLTVCESLLKAVGLGEYGMKVSL